MRSIEKIVMDGEMILDICNDEDFNYSFHLHDQLKITTETRGDFVGTLSFINDNFLIIQLLNNDEKIKIMYSEIVEIDEI